MVCLDDTTLAPGDWLVYNEDEATWKQNDVEYSLADTSNGDEFEATEGELITVFELEDEGPVEGGTYYTIVNSGSTYAEISPVSALDTFVAALNEDAQAQAIGTYAVSGDDIAIAPSQQFTQILAALEQGGAQAEAVQQYWAQFKAALLKISNDAANAVDPDPSVNVIYNSEPVFSANAGTITYNKYN